MNMETQVPASLSARLSSLRATNELLPNLRPHPTPRVTVLQCANLLQVVNKA